MKTKEFLVFKDRLIEYLRSFVKSLQVNVTAIEQQLRSVDREVVNQILQKVTEYELSIPRMDTEIDEQMIYDKMKGRWESISEWFSGKDGMESEAGKVFDTTNEIIRKITRYATRISEMSNQGSNRREEYKKAGGHIWKVQGYQRGTSTVSGRIRDREAAPSQRRIEQRDRQH